jgi:hypothetical protein
MILRGIQHKSTSNKREGDRVGRRVARKPRPLGQGASLSPKNAHPVSSSFFRLIEGQVCHLHQLFF